MTYPGQPVTVKYQAMLWDGTNGADICAMLTWQDQDSGQYSVAEEIPGDYLRCQTTTGGSRYVYAHSPWVVINQADGSPDLMPQASFEARYYSGSDVPAAQNQVRTISYYGDGFGVNASAIGINAVGNIDVKVSPPMPAALIGGTSGAWTTTANLKSDIMASSGINLGTVSVNATPTIITPLVAASTTNGVLTPAHTLVRTPVRNSGLSILSTMQIKTTAHY